MKLMIGALFIVVNAIASDSVILDDDRVKLYSNPAILEKTIDTPEILDLTVPVPTDVVMCVPGFHRLESRPNGERCGYEYVVDHCGSLDRGPRYRGNGRAHLPRPHVYPNRTRVGRPAMPVPRGGVARATIARPAPRCFPHTRKVPKTCTYKVCDRKYIETKTVMKKIRVDFSEYPEDESFEFSLDQHGTVKFLPLYSAPTCTKVDVFGTRPNITGAKVIKKDNWWNWSCN